MATLLNEDYIRHANAASHFDSGDSIEREANNTLARFDTEFSTDGLTDEQKQYLAERRDQWRVFVVNHYNDQCRRRGDYMPVTVCGPARYNSKKEGAKVDKILKLSVEFSEKVKKFFGNTHKHLAGLIATNKTEKADPTIQGWKFDGGEVVANRDADRLQIIFDEKPDDEQRALLKKAAFKWSPRFGAWQRQLTRNAVFAAKAVLDR